MPSNAALLQLDYHSKPARSWRWIRCSIEGLLVMSVAAALFWQKPIADRVRLLYWQHRWLTFEAPTDRIVLEAGAVAIQRWAGVPGYSIHPMDSNGRPLEHALYLPPEFANYLGTVRPITGLNPSRPTGIAFLHRLARPDGQQRIVAITAEIFGASNPGTQGDELDGLLLSQIATEVISPFHRMPPKFAGVFSVVIFFRHDTALPLRRVQVFAGQPDVTDPRCGRIRFDVDGVSHRVDFRLQDNDRLVFDCDLWPEEYRLRLKDGNK